MGRLADRLDHLGQCCIGFMLDEFPDFLLVIVVVAALVVMACRRQRLERATFATLLHQLSHPGFAAAMLLRYFSGRPCLVVCPRHGTSKIH